MATSYVSYTTIVGTSQVVLSIASIRAAQTFTTPSSPFPLSQVKIYTSKHGSGGLLGTVSFKVYPVDGSSKPTGTMVSSGTYDGDTIPAASIANTWIVVPMTVAQLDVSTEYALVVYPLARAGTMHMHWRMDAQAGYADGQNWDSTDSGGTWAAGSVDLNFDILGGSIFPSDAISRVTSLTHRYDRGTYTLEINLGEVVSDFGLPEPLSKPRQAVEPTPEEKQAFQEDEARRLRISPPVPEPEIVEPTVRMEAITPYEAKAYRLEKEAAGEYVTPTARSIRTQVEEADKIAILQEIERLNRSARATGLTPYARDVLQRAIIRKQEELRKLYNA